MMVTGTNSEICGASTGDDPWLFLLIYALHNLPKCTDLTVSQDHLMIKGIGNDDGDDDGYETSGEDDTDD